MRTAFGTFGGSPQTVNPTRMSVIVIEEVLKRAGIQKESVGEVIFGQVLTRTDENNLVSRGAALAAGIPDSVPAHTTIRDSNPDHQQDCSLKAGPGRCLKPTFIISNGKDNGLVLVNY